MTLKLFGFEISGLSLEKLVERVVDRLSRSARPVRLMAMNPAKVTLAARDPRLENALREAEIRYPDGLGICLASRLLAGHPLPRVPGVDLATALAAEGARRGWSVYLLGGRAEVNVAAGQALRRRFPGLRIAGCHHGYFGPDEERSVVDQVNATDSDLLFVALGSPAQELWIHRHASELDVGVAMGLGGTFDVWAGRARRAPAKLRTLGLEWSYRLLTEPRRALPFVSTHLPFLFRLLSQTVLGPRKTGTELRESEPSPPDQPSSLPTSGHAPRTLIQTESRMNFRSRSRHA